MLQGKLFFAPQCSSHLKSTTSILPCCLTTILDTRQSYQGNKCGGGRESATGSERDSPWHAWQFVGSPCPLPAELALANALFEMRCSRGTTGRFCCALRFRNARPLIEGSQCAQEVPARHRPWGTEPGGRIFAHRRPPPHPRQKCSVY